jgi:hypothetical protein
LEFDGGGLRLEIFEDGVPPQFRLHTDGAGLPREAEIETERHDGSHQTIASPPIFCKDLNRRIVKNSKVH